MACYGSFDRPKSLLPQTKETLLTIANLARVNPSSRSHAYDGNDSSRSKSILIPVLGKLMLGSMNTSLTHYLL